MAVLLKAEEKEIQIIYPADGETFTLEELQKAVGGYIEIAPHCLGEAPSLAKRIIIVDEEGRIKKKPLNNTASVFCNQLLFGDVLFCKSNEIK